MATLYNAASDTGIYMPEKDSEARLNPMYSPDTHAKNDKYLYNRLTSSIVKPPVTIENECAVLVDMSWRIITNRIGQYYYQENGTRVEITEVGVDLPDGCIQENPPSKYHKEHNGIEWIFDLHAAQTAVKETIHEGKKQARDAGVTVDGILFDTDISARVSYQDFQAELSLDPDYVVDKWRASEGIFVKMDAALYTKVKAAGKKLLTDVYAWQSLQEAKVAAVVDLTIAQEELGKISTVYSE